MLRNSFVTDLRQDASKEFIVSADPFLTSRSLQVSECTEVNCGCHGTQFADNNVTARDETLDMLLCAGPVSVKRSPALLNADIKANLQPRIVYAEH